MGVGVKGVRERSRVKGGQDTIVEHDLAEKEVRCVVDGHGSEAVIGRVEEDRCSPIGVCQ